MVKMENSDRKHLEERGSKNKTIPISLSKALFSAVDLIFLV